MSDASKDLNQATGIPEVKILDTPAVLKPVENAVSQIPQPIRQSVVAKVISWFVGLFKK